MPTLRTLQPGKSIRRRDDRAEIWIHKAFSEGAQYRAVLPTEENALWIQGSSEGTSPDGLSGFMPGLSATGGLLDHLYWQHNACIVLPTVPTMPSLQIRNLPDDIYQALLFRADRAHRSLAQQAIVELQQATGHTDQQRRRILARIRDSLAERGPIPTTPPEKLIRDDRDR